MPTQRSTILGAGVLLLLQAVVLWTSDGRSSGTLLSDVVQLLLGLLCVLESVRALKRSTGGWRRYWQWLAATFGTWVVAQFLGTFIDASTSPGLDPLDNLLFFFAGIPFGMLIFLDPDQDNDRLDRLHLLDFLQICAFWFCVYLYFSKDQNFALTNTGWGPFGWSTSLVFKRGRGFVVHPARSRGQLRQGKRRLRINGDVPVVVGGSRFLLPLCCVLQKCTNKEVT